MVNIFLFCKAHFIVFKLKDKIVLKHNNILFYCYPDDYMFWSLDGQVTETYSHQDKNKIIYFCVY